MIELRLNPETGKHEVPGKPHHGRVYKVVDLFTGEVGYNYSVTDLPELPKTTVSMIEGYDTFRGWVTDMIPIEQVVSRAKELTVNDARVFFGKALLHARDEQRVPRLDENVRRVQSVIDDMREMYNDIMGRRVRPALPGWKS